MQSGKLLLGLIVLCAASPSMAQMLSLNSDQGVQGAYRYCEYSNSKIYGFPAGMACPPTFQAPAANGKGMGYFKAESHEGSNKLCIYRVSGQDRSIRIDTHANCPLNQEF
jgi:hypothetical protein